jgi:hypothetical protein
VNDPIACAVCRDELATGARVYIVDRTIISFGRCVTGGPSAEEYGAESNEPRVTCSKACARQALKNL